MTMDFTYDDLKIIYDYGSEDIQSTLERLQGRSERCSDSHMRRRYSELCAKILLIAKEGVYDDFYRDVITTIAYGAAFTTAVRTLNYWYGALLHRYDIALLADTF